MIPDGVYDYDVLGHWNNDKFVYELQVHMSDRIKMLPFKHPLFKYESSRNLFAKISYLYSNVSKISASGVKVICVPVSSESPMVST